MNEYRVVWHQCPHVRHDAHVLFVEAGSEDDAIAIVRNHVERKLGVEWFTIKDVRLAKPVPAGQVLGG